MLRYIDFADTVSAWFGKAFAWCVVVMMLAVSYEVVARYAFNAPTVWAFDLTYIMYGSLFMMAGAYTLSRDGHVRGDFVYRLWKPATQAKVELVLYFIFFFPGVLALVFSGWKYASRSWRYLEVSTFSPANVPIYQFKTVIIAAGILLVIQGIAQVFRCIVTIRTGAWPPRKPDVEETEILAKSEKAEALQHGSEAVDVVTPKEPRQ